VRFDTIDDAAWDRSFALNLGAPFALAHAARGPLRASGGSIVFITCTSPRRPYRNYAPYIVAKAALSQLTRVLALELAPDVRVNAVAPGVVLPPDDMPSERLDAIVRQVPLGRTGSAEDVAEAVYYLATAPYVTGHELVVDGGRSVGPPDEPEGA
jgi:pteridine reductase